MPAPDAQLNLDALPPTLDRPLFVSAAVDDFGFTPSEFRVLGRISRRGECFESVPKMAVACKLDDDTVWKCIASLQAFGVIERISRPGQTSILRVLPPSQWKQPTRNGGAPENTGHLAKPGGYHPKRRGSNPPENTGHKGIPSEGNPKKEEPLIVFEPVKLGLWPREYDGMIAHAKAQIKAIAGKPESYVKDLTDSAFELIEWLTKEQGENWQARVEEIYQRPESYERKNLKPKPLLAVRAWKDRITEIERAKAGIKN